MQIDQLNQLRKRLSASQATLKKWDDGRFSDEERKRLVLIQNTIEDARSLVKNLK